MNRGGEYMRKKAWQKQCTKGDGRKERNCLDNWVVEEVKRDQRYIVDV